MGQKQAGAKAGAAVVERVPVGPPASYETLMEQVRSARAELQRLQLEVDLQHVAAMSIGDTATAARMRPTVRELERMAANLAALEADAREARVSTEQRAFHGVAEELTRATVRASTSMRRAAWSLFWVAFTAIGTNVAMLAYLHGWRIEL